MFRAGSSCLIIILSREALSDLAVVSFDICDVPCGSRDMKPRGCINKLKRQLVSCCFKLREGFSIFQAAPSIWTLSCTKFDSSSCLSRKVSHFLRPITYQCTIAWLKPQLESRQEVKSPVKPLVNPPRSSNLCSTTFWVIKLPDCVMIRRRFIGADELPLFESRTGSLFFVDRHWIVVMLFFFLLLELWALAK